jgi:hypothetical protein
MAVPVFLQSVPGVRFPFTRGPAGKVLPVRRQPTAGTLVKRPDRGLAFVVTQAIRSRLWIPAFTGMTIKETTTVRRLRRIGPALAVVSA